ncbi:YdeI/OmpD-associated family protein [Patescibacteria group bacterium]|nr:YdeI/OmpD-associated family protein [Patescibacteria group bacterium]
MTPKKISAGTVHTVPADLREALSGNKSALEQWESLTPLARNEWICWNMSVKQAITRKQHIERTIQDLQKGKRRPCCWYGCIHRTDKEISPSVQWVLSRRSKKAS